MSTKRRLGMTEDVAGCRLDLQFSGKTTREIVRFTADGAAVGHRASERDGFASGAPAAVAFCRRLSMLLGVCLACCAGFGIAGAHAQGSRKDDIVFNAQGKPMAGATVRICTASATGQPCTPLANIYSDPGLTQAVANPTTTDGLGNYSFYAAPGRYEVEISGPNITTKQLPNVILPNDPTNPTFATISTTSGR